MGSFRTILGLDRFFGSRSAKRAGQVGERLRRERKAVVQPALERLESRINLSFSNLNTIAQSMQLGEAALPQVPGLDASVAQMLPTSLSDIVGLNAYGNASPLPTAVAGASSTPSSRHQPSATSSRLPTPSLPACPVTSPPRSSPPTMAAPSPRATP